MKKHDESKDLKCLERIAKVSLYDKTIRASKSTTIGIRSWGRIDYLVNYCGWHFIWDNQVLVRNNRTQDDNSDKIRKRDVKKATKEQGLPNKKKRK